jgi:hypothetical protein
MGGFLYLFVMGDAEMSFKLPFFFSKILGIFKEVFLDKVPFNFFKVNYKLFLITFGLFVFSAKNSFNFQRFFFCVATYQFKERYKI